MVHKNRQTQTDKDFQAFKFAAATSDETISLALLAVEFGNVVAQNAQQLKYQGLEAGYKFLEYEQVAGKNELLRLLKHCYPQDLVRYFRNCVAQAKLVDLYPQLLEKILNLPACYASALLAGSEEQVAQILEDFAAGNEPKWTIKLIEEHLRPDATPETAAPPAIAIGIPVKVLIETQGIEPGAIGTVEALEGSEEEIASVAVSLFSGEHLQLHPADVEPLHPDIFQQLLLVLHLSENLHAQFKTACAFDNSLEQKEIETKIAQFTKCRRLLSMKLRISEISCSQLLKNLPPVNPNELATPDFCEKAFNAYNIAEDADKKMILAKAKLPVRLRNPGDTEPKFTAEQLTAAIASFLFKPAKKTGNSGIPMSTRDFNELMELIQQQHAERQAERESAQERERELLAIIEELRREKETEKNAQPEPELRENDIVRVKTHRVAANIGKIGRFLGFEKQDNGLAEWVEAKILIDEGGKYPMPIFVKEWQTALESVNLTPAELVEINRSRSIALEHIDQSRAIEELRERAVRCTQLEREIEQVKEIYSPEALATELGRTLAGVIGYGAAEELKAAGSGGLKGIGRQLKKFIGQMTAGAEF